MAAVCPFTTAFPAAPSSLVPDHSANLQSGPQASLVMGIVVRVANSFAASKTPPFPLALKEWCRVFMVGGTDAHPSHLGVERPNVRPAVQARIEVVGGSGVASFPLDCRRPFSSEA
jgi:hypothetical protein